MQGGGRGRGNSEDRSEGKLECTLCAALAKGVQLWWLSMASEIISEHAWTQGCGQKELETPAEANREGSVWYELVKQSTGPLISQDCTASNKRIAWLYPERNRDNFVFHLEAGNKIAWLRESLLNSHSPNAVLALLWDFNCMDPAAPSCQRPSSSRERERERDLKPRFQENSKLGKSASSDICLCESHVSFSIFLPGTDDKLTGL